MNDYKSMPTAPSYPLPIRLKLLMANRLREERKRIKLTQKQYAQRLQVPLYKYRQYENGDIDISIDLLWSAYTWEADIQYIITGHRSRFLITDYHQEVFKAQPHIIQALD